MKKILRITGLDCAACATELEEELTKLGGVEFVSVSFVNQTITVEYAEEETLGRVIEYANHFEEVKVVEERAKDKIVLHIENLDCPVCAEALQGDLSKVKGVKWVSVEYISQTITLEVEEQSAILRVIKKANAFEDVRVLDGGRYEVNNHSHRKEWIRIVISSLCFLVGIVLECVGVDMVAVVAKYACYLLAYLTVGYPVLIATVKNIAKGRIFDENFLMTVASIGAIVLGEMSESVLVMLLYQIGELLQSMAVGSSRRSITELMELKSERAIVQLDGEQKEVAPEEVAVGDVLVIKAGEKVPVDGVLLSEYAVLDTKSLTGESEPRGFKKGDEILSGCVNVGGMYEVKAIRPYQESAVGKILELVENASSFKAAPEKFITKFARIYTPIVCVLALLLAVFAPLLSALILENSFYFMDWQRWLQTALTFLVISCPCALIISVPLTYFSGIGACAKKGILVKGATYLDVLSKVKTMAFDKTGTLTEGDFSIRFVHAMDATNEESLVALISAVERSTVHPIAKAFESVKTNVMVSEVQEVAGQGLLAKWSGKKVCVGNEKLMRACGVEFFTRESVYTIIHVAVDGVYWGCVEVGDRLRENAKFSLDELRKLGMERLVMLTGDGIKRAKKIANEVGMYEVKAELLPDEKLLEMQKLQAMGLTAYIGDGMNDAPVMAVADCAISMGKLGSAAAVEGSNLVLISDDLLGVCKAVKIARKTRKIVVENILFSILMKTIFMILGVLGLLPLWLAVFADVGVMLLAVANSFRVRFDKK